MYIIFPYIIYIHSFTARVQPLRLPPQHFIPFFGAMLSLVTLGQILWRSLTMYSDV